MAHITQAEAEALKEFDAAVDRIEEFVKTGVEKPIEQDTASQPQPVLKKKRVVEPAKLVASPYLETLAEVEGFLNALRQELEKAIVNKERIEIR